MKKFTLTLLVALLTMTVGNFAQAQSNKAIVKSLKSKAIKSARKEAKKMKRDGYYVSPGSLPIDKQLENAWIKSSETDDQGYPQYIVATGNAVAETQSAAKLQANELAKFELAGTISTQVASLIEGNVANAQLNAEEASSVTEVSAAIKNIVAQEIGRVIPLVEIYRKVGKNIEASIRIAYSSEMAEQAAKKVLRKELKEKTALQQEKLEKLMDF